MRPVQRVGNTENGRETGHCHAGLRIQRRLFRKDFFIGKITVVEADDTGDDGLLFSGDSDDLRGFQNVVGALGQIGHADILAAVMESCGDLQKKPLPASHSVQFFRALKNLQGDLAYGAGSVFAALIAAADLFRTGQDILFKIMRLVQVFVFFSIFIGDPVSQSHAGNPDEFGIHTFCDALEHDG